MGQIRDADVGSTAVQHKECPTLAVGLATEPILLKVGCERIRLKLARSKRTRHDKSVIKRIIGAVSDQIHDGGYWSLCVRIDPTIERVDDVLVTRRDDGVDSASPSCSGDDLGQSPRTHA